MCSNLSDIFKHWDWFHRTHAPESIDQYISLHGPTTASSGGGTDIVERHRLKQIGVLHRFTDRQGTILWAGVGEKARSAVAATIQKEADMETLLQMFRQYTTKKWGGYGDSAADVQAYNTKQWGRYRDHAADIQAVHYNLRDNCNERIFFLFNGLKLLFSICLKL